MGCRKRELIESINKSMTAVQSEADRCRCLMTAVLEREIDEQLLAELSLLVSPPCCKTEKLKEAMREAIEVLEESRKAFKSKRLEALRKKLTQVLIETE